MQWLTNLPIRTKITLINVLTCSIALLLAGAISVAYNHYTYRTQKVDEVTAQAQLLAAGLVAPLEFEDPKAAQEYLNPLVENREVDAAAVYTAKGTLFARYIGSGALPPPAFSTLEGLRIIGNKLVISWAVMQGERHVGSVYLRVSMQPLVDRIAGFGGIIVLAMMVSLLITLPIAMRLHYAIANPVYARSLLEASLDPFVAINLEGKITDVNEATVKATGLSRVQLFGKDFTSYFTDPEKARDSYQLVFAKGSVTDYPLTLRHVDGKATNVLYNASVYKDERGKVLGVFAAARDVTAQKQAEEEIRKRSIELQAANQELEAFSYSVSHDLRSPLRSIDGFSQALLEDCSDQLDDQGKNYLDRVRAATQRMGQLIDDLLELSRVTRADMRQEVVKLSDLAQDVVADLQRSQPERKVEWHIEPGLEAVGDPQLLRIVLDNLLSNAWKYTAHQPEPHVEFGALPKADGTEEFFVRDNGAGFDMAYAGKLFGAFQRLHSFTEFPGTGIGLATVQRIVRRHGGLVHGHAAINEGATFYFSIPAST